MSSAHRTAMCRLRVRNRNALGLMCSPSAFFSPPSSFCADLETRRRQSDVGRGPRLREPLLHRCCLRRLPLCPQCSGETEQRPPVLREALEVLAINGFCLGGPAGLQECRAERLTDRVIPLGRLEVEASVLYLERLTEVRDAL